jgi:hypothetical protein
VEANEGQTTVDTILMERKLSETGSVEGTNAAGQLSNGSGRIAVG